MANHSRSEYGNIAKTIPVKQYVFALDGVFQGKRLYFDNKTYFPDQEQVGNRKYVNLPTCNNNYMENEMQEL